MSEQEATQETVQETVISQEMFNPDNLAEAVIAEVALAPENVVATIEGFTEAEAEIVLTAPAEQIVEVAQPVTVTTAAAVVVEKTFHPEVGVTREKIDHKILTSHIKNPA